MGKISDFFSVKHKIDGRIEKIYFLKIPFWKIKYMTYRIKIYFLGVQVLVFNVRADLLGIKQEVVKPDNYLNTQILQLRTVDVIMKENYRNYMHQEK